MTSSVLPPGVTTIGILPGGTLQKVLSGRDLPGLKPIDFGLVGESINEAAERSWTLLRGCWRRFKGELDRLPLGDKAIGVTREYWLVRLFHELGFGRLSAIPAGGLVSDDGEKRFPISHRWEHVPIHQLGWGVSLAHRTPGVPGAAVASPQSTVQEYLNRSAAALWGIVTNGRQLRVLRDSSALAGVTYIEFDLEEIFDGELFGSFILLYRLAHVSRFESREETGAASCLLERWRTDAIATGVRVLDQLCGSVREAVEILGTGFVRNFENRALRTALADPGDTEIVPETLRRALFRLVYRLLFLCVVEDRGLLLHPEAGPAAQQRYRRFFSSARLRRLAATHHGDHHGDQWQALRIVIEGLGREDGLPELGLPALGGIFEPAAADTVLSGAELANDALYRAARALSRVRDAGTGRTRPVDFRNLGAEELGSVYEQLLQYFPKYDPDTGEFHLVRLEGNERKTTGSYYTPASLAEQLLDTALDPVIDEAVKSADTQAGQEEALLALTVLDPACGSGHLLVAAARRIAKRLAFVRTGDPEPDNGDLQRALRDVVSRCVYGVDLNPTAVELTKIALWMEGFERGKPLSFLDAQIKVGNSLLGVTPALLAEGIPDAAFTALDGDDKPWASALRKRNRIEREALAHREESVQLVLEDAAVLRSGNRSLARLSTAIRDAPHDTFPQIRAKYAAFTELLGSAEYRTLRSVADAWCAAFFWTKSRASTPAITTQTLLDLAEDPTRVPAATRDQLESLTECYRYFHWHLEFPQILRTPSPGRLPGLTPVTGWAGGFSCVLANPPWERIKLQEQEFFASRDKTIAQAANKAARDRLLKVLPSANPALHAAYLGAKRVADSVSLFLRASGRNPLTGHGDINTYSVFTEASRLALGPSGRLGIIVPTGIATDATTADFFGDLVSTRSLVSIHEFENEEKLFTDVHHSFRFCLLTVAGRGIDADRIELAFRARQVTDLDRKRFELIPEDIARLNPNTLTCPVFDDTRHARIVTGIYRRIPVLWREHPEENSWGLSFLRMFDMANDAHHFATGTELERDSWELEGNVFVRGAERMLPLFEAKMLHHFDSRFATYEGVSEAQLNKSTLPRLTTDQHADPDRLPLPRYWVPETEVNTRLARRGWTRDWLLGWRDICRSTDERTMIPAILPANAVGHKFPLATGRGPMHLLAANWSSLVFDYVSRQKFSGSSMTYFILKQLPALTPAIYRSRPSWLTEASLGEWISDRLLELMYTGNDLAGFARDLGDDGAPFLWDEHRRFLMRAELDAAYFHLYGISHEDTDYILDSFRAFQNNDLVRFARTKQTILDIHDAMTRAKALGTGYRTALEPLPGQSARHPATDRRRW